MTLLPKVKLKAAVNFPASVLDGTGIDVTKSNGTYRFDLDFADFAPPVGSVTDAAHQNALLWNSVTGSYTLAPMALLSGGSLPDAPNTGLQYGRQSLGWTPIVIPATISPSATIPVMDGIAIPGVATAYSRGDHVHPTDTSRAPAVFTQIGTGAVNRTMLDKARDTLNIYDFGAKGDCVNLLDGAITASSTAFTAASGSFSSGDVGKLIRVRGAGAASAVLETTIAAFVSATAVTLTAAAGTTVSGANVFYGSDETAAIQATVNSTLSSQNPARIILPGRIFMTTAAITVPANMTLSLTGKGISSLHAFGPIIMPSVSTDGIVITSNDSATLDNFGICYAGPANTGTAAIRFTPGLSSYNFYSTIRNLTIQYPYDGIIANEATACTFDGNRIVGFGNTAITHNSVLGVIPGDNGDNKIINNWFQPYTSSPLACFRWTGGGGVSFRNNKCMLSQYGALLQPAHLVTTSQLSFVGNSFDGHTNSGVVFGRVDNTSTITQIIISSNTFNMFQGTPGAIAFGADASVGVNTVTITGNTFLGPSAGANTQIDLSAVDNVIISGNAFKSQHASTNSLSIGALATNVVIRGNSYTGTFASGTGTDDPWISFTPTISAGAGTITTASAAGRYFATGKKVFFHITVTVTTNGTGSSYIAVAGLPAVVGNANQPVFGRNTGSGQMIQGILNSGLATLFLARFDGAYPVVSGDVMIVSGFYETT